jgi:hypothetical protein
MADVTGIATIVGRGLIGSAIGDTVFTAFRTNIKKVGLAAGSKTRVQGEITEQAVTSAPAILHRIVVTNANVAAQNFDLLDGGTTLQTIEVPSDETLSLEFNTKFDVDIRVNPGSTDIDMVVIYD